MKRGRFWHWVWMLVLCFVLLVLPTLGCAPPPPPPSVAPPPPAPAPAPTPTPTPAPTPTLPAIPDADNGAGESDRGTMIDAHSHIRTPNIDIDLDMDYVFSFLDQANVSKVVLFGPPLPLQNVYAKHPDRVIPFLCPLPEDFSTGKLIISHERLGLVENWLKSGLFKGIGEISLRHRGLGIHHPPDDPLMLELYDLAAQYSVPVNVHVDFEYSDELERALEHNRKATIIWAHHGHADPPLIRRMMDKHPNLFADLSTSNPYTYPEYTHIPHPTNPDGSIKQEWKQLFEDYSDRLMWGLDMRIEQKRYERVELTVKVTNYYRSLLGQLSPEAAENIAYKTIERILPAPVAKSPRR